MQITTFNVSSRPQLFKWLWSAIVRVQTAYCSWISYLPNEAYATMWTTLEWPHGYVENSVRFAHHPQQYVFSIMPLMSMSILQEDPYLVCSHYDWRDCCPDGINSKLENWIGRTRFEAWRQLTKCRYCATEYRIDFQSWGFRRQTEIWVWHAYDSSGLEGAVWLTTGSTPHQKYNVAWLVLGQPRIPRNETFWFSGSISPGVNCAWCI